MLVIFDIMNTQECYARCLNIIEQIEKSHICYSDSMLDNVYIHTQYSDISIEILASVTAALAEKSLQNLSVTDADEIYANNKNIKYLFLVTCDNSENDIVNIQYYSLIQQQKLDCFLLLQAKEISKHSELYSKAGLFLLYEVQERPSHYYCKKYRNGIVTISKLKCNNNISIIKKMSPLIEITHNSNTVDYWSQPFGLFLTDHNLCKDMSEIIPANSITYNKEIKVKKKQLDKAKNNKAFQLLLIMKNLFCFGDFPITSKTINSFLQRNTFFKSKDFYSHVKDMPLLAFYIMCFYEYYSYEIDKTVNNTEDFLKRLIFDARDMADGLLQLIENAMNHSQNGKGYFCFRIHSTSSLEKTEELETRFRNYLKNKKGEFRYYLEAHVIDYSRISLVQKFLLKTDERKDTAATEYVKKYDAILARFKLNMEMKTFFNPSDTEKGVWAQYNTIDKNVMHHYGLQLFDSLITNSDGCFIAKSSDNFELLDSGFYSNTESIIKTKKIPGTQYIVLIPFGRYSTEKRNYNALSGRIIFNTHISNMYTTRVGFSFDEANCKKVYNKHNINAIASLQERKEKLIDVMSSDFCIYVNKCLSKDVNTIFYYDANDIPNRRIEFFAKALISFLIKNPSNKINIAIFNCNENFFLEITRIFAVFYNKEGKNERMQNAQIYLYGLSIGEEFIITGDSLASFLSYSEKLAFSQGTNPRCVRIITQMLEKRITTQGVIRPMQLTPFSLQTYPELIAGKTPFEINVKNVLDTDIQTISFGCKLAPTHMRLGSKIHINSFYEAELLFHNSYYVSHFSYILAKRINDLYTSMEKKVAQNIVLVGYETYSEMLLYEITDILGGFQDSKLANNQDYSQMSLLNNELEHNNTRTKVEYIIYNDNKKNTNNFSLSDDFGFKYLENVDDVENSLYAIIVPINSTLTTHNKIIAALRKYIATQCGASKTPKIIANYAIIIVRDISNNTSLSVNEKRFWIDIDTNNQIITSPLVMYGEQRVNYVVDLYTSWRNPLTCKACFPPEKQYDTEEPLVETDKASVVPMQKIGLIQSCKMQDYESSYNSLMSHSNLKRIESLKNYLMYKHIERKNNHFSYYFQTEKLMLEEKTDIIRWLKQISNQYESKESKILTYNIIVTPIHFSSSAFVAEVEHHIFNNASLTLFVDAEKEFRENIRTKYSNLFALYQNLDGEQRQSQISFHFVDDTIISGSTIVRIKSLISSIFPDDAWHSENVKIHLFKSITLLINRCSNDTKKNYIKDIKMFNAFVDINISSMRNHEDACVLCKYVKNNKQLSEYASTNVLYKNFCRQVKKHKHLVVKESITAPNVTQDIRERAYRRMICSHIANCELQKVGAEGNRKEEAIEIIKALLVRDSSIEYMISYFKTLSRPFFSFTKSYKEAIFYIMIRTIDYLLCNHSERKEIDAKGFQEIFNIVDDIHEYDINYCLLITLIKRLSDLGSSFIIRKVNMKRILSFHDRIVAYVDNGSKRQEKKRDFEKEYLSAIKRITCLSSDEAKCVFLEYLLIYGNEYGCDIDEEIFEGVFDKKQEVFFSSFNKKVYLENNRLLLDSVKDLYNDITDNTKKITEEYSNGNSIRFDVIWNDTIGITNGVEGNTDEDTTKISIINVIKETLNSQYYYENYIKTLVFIGAVKAKGGKIIRFVNDFHKKIFSVVTIFYLFDNAKSTDGNIDNFYSMLATLIRYVMESNTVQIFLRYSKEGFIDLAHVGSKKKSSIPQYDNVLVRELDLDTFNIDNSNTITLKYDIVLDKKKFEKRDVYIVVEGSALTGILLLNAMKSIMIFRNMLVSKLTNDFASNLISDKIIEKNKAEALAHLKNASHINSSFKNEFTSQYLYSNTYVDGDADKLKAAAIRFLSDLYISEKYHNAIVRSMSNDITEETLLSSISLEDTWVMKNIYLLCKTAHFRLPNMINIDIPDETIRKLHVLYIKPPVEPGDSDALNILLSMIQNALIHAEGCVDVTISTDKMVDKKSCITVHDALTGESSEKLGILYYLTIENEVSNNISEREIDVCLTKNIHERRLEGFDNEGITLYAANKYCEEIIMAIQDIYVGSDSPIIKYTVCKDKIKFKLPILVDWVEE